MASGASEGNSLQEVGQGDSSAAAPASGHSEKGDGAQLGRLSCQEPHEPSRNTSEVVTGETRAAPLSAAVRGSCAELSSVVPVSSALRNGRMHNEFAKGHIYEACVPPSEAHRQRNWFPASAQRVQAPCSGL